jgi:hypothetical protein
VQELSNDEEDISHKPPTKSSSTTSDTPHTRTAKQPHCGGQVNKLIEKKRRRLTAGDRAIASAISEFSGGVCEIEKLKMEVTMKITSQILDSEARSSRIGNTRSAPDCSIDCRCPQNRKALQQL